MEIYHQYTRKRRNFGRFPNFQDESASTLVEFQPEDSYFNDHIERSPVTVNVQIVPEMSENEANTEQVVYKSSGMLHLEGGWPKEVDNTEVEHTVRYRKKIEKDADYIKAVSKVGASVETLIKQNNAVDIYEEYFQGQVVDHSSEPPDARTLQLFKDPHDVPRPVSYLSWYPDGARKVAAAYSVLEFQPSTSNSDLSSYMKNISSYIWDINSPNSPELELLPHSPLCCLMYNPKDPNIIGGGCYNGQLTYWDTRKSGKHAVESSPIENSHRDPAYDMAWLQSKTGTECATVSSDGYCYWWDTRRISEPIESLLLQEKSASGNGVVLGAVSMEYEAVAGPSKFMIGTEQGIVLSCNRKAKTPADRITGSYRGHHGPVYSLERNPFFPKYFVSIGDWTARIWNEDLKTPIVTTKYHQSYLTGGTWSPTRPGVFFSTRSDGNLEVWDFFYKQNDPVLDLKVGGSQSSSTPKGSKLVKDTPLTSFNIQDQGKLIVTGAGDGTITLLELCEGLTVMQQNEKPSIQQMFERESKREKNLEMRAKELKVKARKDSMGNGHGNGGKGFVEAHDNNEEMINSIENDFFDSIRLASN